MPTSRLAGRGRREAEEPGAIHRSSLLQSVREGKEAKIPSPPALAERLAESPRRQSFKSSPTLHLPKSSK